MPSDPHPTPPGAPSPPLPPPDPATRVTPDDPPRRLHPLSMVRGIGPRQLVGAYLPLVVLLSGEGLAALVVAAIVTAFTVLLGVVRVLSWSRRTYEFTAGRIVERSGIVSRSERSLQVDRIQQVDVERTLLDRVVGTCELRLETAADGGESELELRVVSVEEAARLRGLLAAAGVDAADDGVVAGDPTGDAPTTVAADDLLPDLLVPEEPRALRRQDEVLVAVPLRHVVLAAVTGQRLLTVPLAAAALVGFLAEYEVAETVAGDVGERVAAAGVAGIVVLVLLGLVLVPVIAITAGLLRDGGFTIAARGSDLQVRRGLTTTRSATVPLRRVQRVQVDRSWPRARLGFATVTLYSAGGGGGGGSSATDALDRSLTVPLLPEADVDALVRRLLGVAALPTLEPHPPVVRRRLVVRSLAVSLLVVLAAAVPAVAVPGASPWWLVGLAALLAARSWWLGGRRYRWLATGVDDAVVASRHGTLGSTVELTPLRKTQGVELSTTPFQRRAGLASVEVRIAGPAGGVRLVDLDADHARALTPQLLR